MAADKKSRKRLANSLQDAISYPTTVEKTHKSAYALASYRRRLEKDGTEIFVSNELGRVIFLWDLADADGKFQPERRVPTMEQLRGLMNVDSTQPRSRFIFIHTTSSRGPLCCSRDQLTYILTYYQVMPAFLDFCFQFRNREKPMTTNMFRLEDILPAREQNSTSPSSEMSEIRIQHAFNIMAFEEDTGALKDKDESPKSNWLLRHTTVYHSFDLQQGRSTWIIIKGNRSARERLTFQPERERTDKVELEMNMVGQFRAALYSHLRVLETIENWGRYVDYLEERSRMPISRVKHVPVETLARNTARMAQPRPLTIESKTRQRTGTGMSIRRAFSAVSGIAGMRQLSDPEGGITAETNNDIKAASGEDDTTLDQIFTFDALQDAYRVAEDVQTSSLVVDQNLKTLAQLKNRYSALATREDLGLIADDINEFVQQIAILEGDMESHQYRIKTLLHSLEMHDDMFRGILGYGNMRTGENFARSAQASAHTMEALTERMHEIATKTEQETISMHVITVFTLIFLPGTFVCTLFSAEIMDFDGGNGTTKIGDWKVRWPALKLFLAVCIPLMAITLSAWCITYMAVRRQHKADASALKAQSKNT